MSQIRASLAGFFLPIAVMAGSGAATLSQSSDVMVAAVSRDDSTLNGGIGSGRLTQPGKVAVEILAYLTPDGEWKSHPCSNSYSRQCDEFAKEYLAKSHRYTVVSTDGRGATVEAKSTTLSECYDYTTTGDYAGAPIQKTAIAAESTQIFTKGPPASRLSPAEGQPIRRDLEALVPSKLDSTQELRMYRVQLEGKSFIVVQRAFQDYASNAKYDTGQDAMKLIFVIGEIVKDRFQILHWKENIEDENEQVLGTIHLKSGRDFLITTVSDPASQTFHVYGIRNGKLTLVYSGGGSSC